MKIDMRWQRIEFKFPEIFLPDTLRGNVVEFIAIKYKHVGVPSEETAYNVRPAGDL